MSIEIGRMSVTPRPSIRSPRSTMSRRTSAFSTVSKAARIAPFFVSSAPMAWTTSSNTRPTASARPCFS